MSLDKLVDSSQLDTDLTSVANAIRTKGGTSAQLAFPAGFVSAVQAIPTGTTPTGTKQISITANGTTTEDVTNYANAEITVNVPSSSGGWKLLASGTYTKSSDSASITIPVTYTGTPKEWFYYYLNPDKTIQQTVLGFRRLTDNDADLSAMMPNGIYCHWIAKSGSIVAASQPQVVTLSSTSMVSTRPGSGNTHKAGTWIWAIYGEEAT